MVACFVLSGFAVPLPVRGLARDFTGGLSVFPVSLEVLHLVFPVQVS